MIEPRCLIGVIDNRDSFQAGFAGPGKWFRRNRHQVSGTEPASAGSSRSNIGQIDQPQNSASSVHPIKGVHNLDLVEHADHALHRPRRVVLSREALAEDAPSILQRA